MPKLAVSLGLTFIVGGIGGFLADALGLPGGWIIGSLAAAYIASLLDVPIAVPPRLRSLAMGFVGMTVGSAIDQDMLRSAAMLPWSLAAMFGVMALMGGLTYALHRKIWNASAATAISCAWPGNVLLAFASARALNADMDRVIVVQLVRVLILMAVMPLAIGTFHSAPSDQAVAATPDFAIAAAIALACTALALRLKLVGGEIFFSAAAIGALTSFEVIRFEVPEFALAGLQVVVGVYIGLGLARCSRQAFLAALSPSLASAALATVMTLVSAFALSGVLDTSAAALTLAYAPGGAEAMILLSAVFDVDPGFVGIHHTLRLLVLTFCFPFALRYFAAPAHQATGSR